MRTTFLVLSILLPLCLHAATPGDPDFSASHRIDAIKSLGLESIPGSMQAFYSLHAEARARYLQGLLGGEIAYYGEQFQFHFDPVALAVLNAPQWSKVAAEEPLGMPSVDGTSPAVVVMPAS